jgi:tyramine---L-glutamate ligase
VQNKPIKKIFVCEFITGGGFNHSEIHVELLEQGQRMRDALLRDLSQLPCQIITTVDARLTRPVNCDLVQFIHADEDVWQCWENNTRLADAVWFIAPETHRYLEKMTALAVKHGKIIIGCGLTSIRICSSKLATYQLLRQANIATVDTCLYANWDKTKSLKWLAKPDDGAGCEETVCFDTAEKLENWILQNGRVGTHIIQPFLHGDAASVSCVMHHGKATVLSCNQQLITIEENGLCYKGCVINAMQRHWESFAALANQIAQLLPDLAGYVGIDVMVNQQTTEPAKVTVIEINPRLTTSYVALQEATGYNPAALILNVMFQENTIWPELMRNEVLLEVSACHA